MSVHSLDRLRVPLHHRADPSFRFRNGEFTMIGLKVGEKAMRAPLGRQSKIKEDGSHFFSTVPDGRCLALSPEAGDEIIVSERHTARWSSKTRGAATLLIGTRHGLGPVPFRDQGSRDQSASSRWCAAAAAA